MSFLGEWITGTYKAFNDADKYIILGYLFRKTVTFYYDNFIKVNYETFYKTDHFDIEKINIVEISKALDIPKETARRKVTELEKVGVPWCTPNGTKVNYHLREQQNFFGHRELNYPKTSLELVSF